MQNPRKTPQRYTLIATARLRYIQTRLPEVLITYAALSKNSCAFSEEKRKQRDQYLP